MPSRPSRSSSRALAAAILLAACALPGRAWGQACCAGGSVVTPGRLELHEDALVGLQQKVGVVSGSYDIGGRYVRSPAGDDELDAEQDLFAAVRVARRGQLALLVPFIETRRATPQIGAQVGRGVGDVNASGRWDFIDAGASRWVPGIALLAGLTLPTGRPPESATPPLFTDSTGIGAYQINAALALEQTFGPWLVNATGMIARRTQHQGETLGTQGTLLAAGAYTFPDDIAVALSVAYAWEGDATASDGSDAPFSAHRTTTVTASGLWPFADSWRLLGGFYFNPPLDSFGSNTPATSGLSLTLVRSWS